MNKLKMSLYAITILSTVSILHSRYLQENSTSSTQETISDSYGKGSGTWSKIDNTATVCIQYENVIEVPKGEPFTPPTGYVQFGQNSGQTAYLYGTLASAKRIAAANLNQQFFN